MWIGQLVDLVLALLVKLNKELGASFTVRQKAHRFYSCVLKLGLLLNCAAIRQVDLKVQLILINLISNGLLAIEHNAHARRAHTRPQVRNRRSASQGSKAKQTYSNAKYNYFSYLHRELPNIHRESLSHRERCRHRTKSYFASQDAAERGSANPSIHCFPLSVSYADSSPRGGAKHSFINKRKAPLFRGDFSLNNLDI